MPTETWFKTGHRGLEFKRHPSRKHGVKFDRYFRGRVQVEGKRKSIGLGWESEGVTETAAWLKLEAFRENMAKGAGPTTKAEERRAERDRVAREKAEVAAAAEAARLEAEKAKRENVTVTEFWNAHYFPQCKRDKAEKTARNEGQLFKNWIQPILGGIPLRNVKAADVERLKNSVLDAPPLVKSKDIPAEAVAQRPKGRSPRTCEYVLAVTRQLFNQAANLGIYDGKNPVSSVKKPKVANERKRFLTHTEAEELLAVVKDHSEQLHDICLLSLRAGLRAGEIFNLQWADVDFARGTLLVRDPKLRPDRTAYMTSEVRDMLKRQPRIGSAGGELVFKDTNGNQLQEISHTFDRVVTSLGLNDGITDRRHKLVFHSLRHSFASQLVEGGVHLHVVRELLGHSTLKMTERYSHVGTGQARRAVQGLDTAAQAAKTAGKVIPFGQTKAAGGDE
ncbi:MAG: site-specific integrase [Desulfovibrionales bacterium]|nr:MAG: site-specific integrase [Desulfovibrionales bacterium]